MTRPKIGVLFLTSGWFRDVGLQTEESGLSRKLDGIAREIVKRISAFAETVFSGVVFSVEEARKAAANIREGRVDGMIVAPLTWCEDQILRAALKELDPLPILLWTCLPSDQLPDHLQFQETLWGSSAVGSLQLSGLLKRDGLRYGSVVGHYRDPETYDSIRLQTAAIGISRKLHRLRVGVLPFRCDQMSTTYVDEYRLRKAYGVEVQYLELETVRRAAQSVPELETTPFMEGLSDRGYIVEVDERNLREASKYAIAFDRLFRQEGLDLLAMNDVIDEMHSCFGLRPCLDNPALAQAEAVVSMEADISAALAMKILRLSSGESPFYTEPQGVDIRGNSLLMGHAGYHDSSNRDPEGPLRIVPDVEYMSSDRFSGAAVYFKYRPGPVTAVNSVFHGERLKWQAFEGESLPGAPVLEGNCHLLCRLEADVRTVLNRSVEGGASQHWVVYGGHRLKELKMICQWLDIELLELR
jgi:L-fucose isomerase-like protein